jgi:hypothetical protein
LVGSEDVQNGKEGDHVIEETEEKGTESVDVFHFLGGEREREEGWSNYSSNHKAIHKSEVKFRELLLSVKKIIFFFHKHVLFCSLLNVQLRIILFKKQYSSYNWTERNYKRTNLRDVSKSNDYVHHDEEEVDETQNVPDDFERFVAATQRVAVTKMV